ncbi:O-antigen polymerase [Photobacterium phosphoreum]|uniref:O-antigen polymerase n=1 Tax=Photobacterium phosphoreum TaxID=659 RepID=UPI001E5EDB89|nr:O-antigen polymerase [Photobacterium phosphoreum]MCD9511861.1 hypothetical protein [Photobacterium phosphoreum]
MIEVYALLYISIFSYRVLKDWKKSFLFTPITSVSFVAFILLLLPAVLDNNIVVSNQAIFGLIILSFFCFYTPKGFYKQLSFFSIKRKKTIRVFFFTLALIHLAITVYFALGIVITYGLVGSFLRNRLEDYLIGNVLSNGLLGTLHLLTQFVFYFVVGSYLGIRNKCKYAFVVMLFYIFCISIYANTRLSLVIPIMIMASYFIYVRRMKYTKILAFVSAVIFILPLYLTISNNMRHGISENQTNVKIEKVIANQLNYNKYIHEMDNYIDNSLDRFEYGYGWFLASIGNSVPRFFWSDKPITSFSNRFTVLVTNQSISLQNPVRTFTIFGTGYSQLSYLGIFIEVFFYLYFFTRLFTSFLNTKYSGGFFIAFYISILSLIYFRGETPFIQLILIYFLYLCRDAYVTNNK